MPAKYKLTYFNLRGIAEPVRYMFAYKNVPYEDIRISEVQWPQLKAKQPFGKLPVLEVDGHVVTESLAVMRFVGRELGLLGKTNIEAAKADMLMEAIQDLVKIIRIFARREKDAEKKKQLKKKFFDEIVPPCFRELERALVNNGGNFIVGDSLTWADFGIAHYVSMIQDLGPGVLLDYPALAAHHNQIHSIPEIKAWIEKRPESDI